VGLHFGGGERGHALAQEDRRQHAQDERRHRHRDRQPAGAGDLVAELPAVHDPQEPRRDDVGDLADEILRPHQARALVVVGRQFVAQRDPRRDEDGVADVEGHRADQEPHEVEVLAHAARQLPQQGEDHGGQDGADEDVRAAAAPARAGVVRDVAHDRVDDRVDQARQRADPAHQPRVHVQAQVQDDHHAADGGRQQVVDERPGAVGDPLRETDPVLGGRLRAHGLVHAVVSLAGFRPAGGDPFRWSVTDFVRTPNKVPGPVSTGQEYSCEPPGKVKACPQSTSAAAWPAGSR